MCCLCAQIAREQATAKSAVQLYFEIESAENANHLAELEAALDQTSPQFQSEVMDEFYELAKKIRRLDE